MRDRLPSKSVEAVIHARCSKKPARGPRRTVPASDIGEDTSELQVVTANSERP